MSDSLSKPLRSREAVALDKAEAALRRARANLIVAVRANVKLADFDPAVREIDAALAEITILRGETP